MRLPLLAVPALLLATSPAHAAAYYFLDAGTRALSRGGAFVAGADDISAQYYNPAALIHLRRPQLTFNLSAVSQYVLFDRADEDGLDPFEAVTNESPPMVIPSFGFASSFGVKDTVFAIGFYPPYAPDMAYPEDGPQRYSLVDTLVWQAYGGVSAAHRFGEWAPWLTVGVGLSWTFMRAEQTLTVALCPNSDAVVCGDNPGQDVGISMAAVDKARFIWNAGVLIKPAPWIQIGASVLPPITFHGKGSITADFTGNSLEPQFASPVVTDDEITLTVPMPLIARLGVAVNPMRNLQVEVAGVYERWSVSKEILIDDVDLTLEPNPDHSFLSEPIVLTDPISLETNYQDAYSVRLGGDWDINHRFTARAGTFLETSGVPAATQGVALVDGLKVGYGVGGAVRIIKPLTLDVALAQSFVQKREITDSEVTLIALKYDLTDTSNSAIGTGKVVGNGSFESHITFLSAGLTWHFGKNTDEDDDTRGDAPKKG